jgi:hypothetical protein
LRLGLRRLGLARSRLTRSRLPLLGILRGGLLLRDDEGIDDRTGLSGRPEGQERQDAAGKKKTGFGHARSPGAWNRH